MVDRSKKENLVASLREGLAEANIVIVAQQTGLTVAEVSDLRRQMREAGAHYKVTKNTLARLAVKGIASEGLYDMLKGPTAIAYSNNPVGAAKVAIKFAGNNNKFKVIAATLDGKILSVKEIDTLSKLPSLEELRAKILGMLCTPATRIAGVIQAPAGQLARVFSAYGNQG
jgi:large subunit ribosomal protein L10